MDIKQILQMPIGQKLGGFVLAVKTAKKKWQIGDNWVHQVLFVDSTGEILADVNIGKYIPLQRGREYRVVVAEVQAEEKLGKKLYVDQFAAITQIGEPDNVMDFPAGESERVIKSKIKCWLVAACIQGGKQIEDISYDEIDELVEYIIK